MKSHLVGFASLLALIALGLISFSATAHAAAAVTPTDGTLLDTLQPVLEAFQHGHYLYAGSMALVLAVAIVRRYAPRYAPSLADWFASDLGSAALALLGAFGASMVARGADVTWGMVWDSLCIAFGAAGGYATIKALVIAPYLTKLAGKGPAWMHEPMQLILWIFQETGSPPTPAEQAVHALKEIDRPDIDVTVAVTTTEGTAIASSPAVAPAAPVTVVTSDVAIPRTPTKP